MRKKIAARKKRGQVFLKGLLGKTGSRIEGWAKYVELT